MKLQAKDATLEVEGSPRFLREATRDFLNFYDQEMEARARRYESLAQQTRAQAKLRRERLRKQAMKQIAQAISKAGAISEDQP